MVIFHLRVSVFKDKRKLTISSLKYKGGGVVRASREEKRWTRGISAMRATRIAHPTLATILIQMEGNCRKTKKTKVLKIITR